MTYQKYTEFIKSSLRYIVSILAIASLLGPHVAFALSAAQKSLFQQGIYYFNSAGDSCSLVTTSGAIADGGIPSDQVKAFLHEPITSTWNIPDNTIEQWFLTQDSVLNTALDKHGVIKGVVPRYGLTSSNINQITTVVRAAGVSPVFFYAYTVTEGGGIGGFVNWKQGIDAPGIENAKSDAARDAAHLAEVASAAPGKYPLAWKDEDHPQFNPVPPDIQTAGNADFANLTSWPLGTLGRLLIPSTAAAVWEVYYPDALKGSVNGVQDYGPPIARIMQTIEGLGANPLDGGATLSAAGCTGSVAGEGMTKAINFAVAIANNDGYGYDQSGRESGWQKWQSDPSCTNQCGSFDCSSLISAALTLAGYFSVNPNFATGGEAASLTGAGFKKVADSATTSTGLLPGDILLWDGHTAMYIGNDKAVAAHIDENGGISGGEVGDQTGKEISVDSFQASLSSDPWIGVFRAQS